MILCGVEDLVHCLHNLDHVGAAAAIEIVDEDRETVTRVGSEQRDEMANLAVGFGRKAELRLVVRPLGVVLDREPKWVDDHRPVPAHGTEDNSHDRQPSHAQPLL